MSDTATALEKIDPADLGPMQREMNKQLFVAWINADLLYRAQHDVRKSVLLYDADKDFVYAMDEEPDQELQARLAAKTNVRYWSVGA